MVRLNWNVLTRSDDANLRFSVRYGTESEKYSKTFAVGTSNEYVLRELKNFQTYYVQVVALDKEKKSVLKSDEILIFGSSRLSH